MFSPISSSCFIQVVMLRICFWFVFAGFTVAAHTARSEEGSFAPDLDVLTIQLVRSDADWLLPYRLNTNVALIRSEEISSVGSEFSNTPRLHLVAEQKNLWSTSARWQIISNSDHTSLSPLLRFESKEERLEIKPQRNSIYVVWRKALPF